MMHKIVTTVIGTILSVIIGITILLLRLPGVLRLGIVVGIIVAAWSSHWAFGVLSLVLGVLALTAWPRPPKVDALYFYWFVMQPALAAEARFEQSKNPSALDEAIMAWESILSHPKYATLPLDLRLRILTTAGRTYLKRCGVLGSISDADRALILLREAVDKTSPASPDLSPRLSNLGGASWYRYLHEHHLAHLDEAINTWKQALNLNETGSLDRSDVLHNLGLGLLSRYLRTGELADLQDAIQVFDEAVRQTPRDSSDWPIRMSSWGSGLLARYERTGELSDLERSIQVCEEAVKKASPDLPEREGGLVNLGNGLLSRYERTGELSDLERSIQVFDEALDQITPASPNWPGVLNNLGNGLLARFSRTGEIADLERAVRMFDQADQAVTGTQPRSPYSYVTRMGLGNALSERYLQTEDMADLKRSIQAYEEAVTASPPGIQAMSRNNLGLGLMDLYHRTEDLADLTQAIRSFEQALAETQSGTPKLPHVCYNLGDALQERYARTREQADLMRAIAVWERAWSSLQTTFTISPLVYKMGQQRQVTSLSAVLVEAQLKRAQVNQSEASAARRRAMEIVEASKSRLLTELIGRADLPAPPDIPPGLVDRERKLMAELTDLDAVELAAYGPSVTSLEEINHSIHLQQREDRLHELNDLWTGMVRFGQEAADYIALRRGAPLAWEDLARMATDLGAETALVSFFTTDDRALLFIVRAGWKEPALEETDFGEFERIDTMRRLFREIHTSGGSRRRGETWHRPLKKLLEKAKSHLDGVTRIVFAPYSMGHLVPWSVVAERAGWRNPDQQVIPIVTVPALGVLSRLRNRPLHRDGPVLVAGNPLVSLSKLS